MATTVLWSPVAAQNSPEGSSAAQRFFPRQGFMLSGYGGAGYNVTFAGDQSPNDFSAIFAPILLYQISDRFLFEGEFEFELEEGVTATELEYAQVDVVLSNNFSLVAGKFLLPFNTFSERHHPSWINRFISAPALYGAHGGATPGDPLLPILSDVGVQLRGAFSVGDFNTITTELFVTQGPMLAEEGADGHVDEGLPATNASISTVSGGEAVGGVAIGTNFTDNNEDKMLGGRIGFNVPPYIEINVSGMTGAYDAAGDLRFKSFGAHLEGRYKDFTLHSEFIQTWQDLLQEEAHDEETLAAAKRSSIVAALQTGPKETLSRNGYWLQLGYRINKWQPVIRWSQLFAGELEGETLTDAGWQLALGIDYWFEPALGLKLEYLINDEEVELDNNRFAVQLAFGF